MNGRSVIVSNQLMVNASKRKQTDNLLEQEKSEKYRDKNTEKEEKTEVESIVGSRILTHQIWW